MGEHRLPFNNGEPCAYCFKKQWLPQYLYGVRGSRSATAGHQVGEGVSRSGHAAKARRIANTSWSKNGVAVGAIERVRLAEAAPPRCYQCSGAATRSSQEC